MVAETSECKINSKFSSELLKCYLWLLRMKTLSENTEKHFIDSLEVFWSTTKFIKFCIVKQDGLFREYL